MQGPFGYPERCYKVEDASSPIAQRIDAGDKLNEGDPWYNIPSLVRRALSYLDKRVKTLEVDSGQRFHAAVAHHLESALRTVRLEVATNVASAARGIREDMMEEIQRTVSAQHNHLVTQLDLAAAARMPTVSQLCPTPRHQQQPERESALVDSPLRGEMAAMITSAMESVKGDILRELLVAVNHHPVLSAAAEEKPKGKPESLFPSPSDKASPSELPPSTTKFQETQPQYPWLQEIAELSEQLQSLKNEHATLMAAFSTMQAEVRSRRTAPKMAVMDNSSNTSSIASSFFTEENTVLTKLQKELHNEVSALQMSFSKELCQFRESVLQQVSKIHAQISEELEVVDSRHSKTVQALASGCASMVSESRRVLAAQGESLVAIKATMLQREELQPQPCVECLKVGSELSNVRTKFERTVTTMNESVELMKAEAAKMRKQTPSIASLSHLRGEVAKLHAVYSGLSAQCDSFKSTLDQQSNDMQDVLTRSSNSTSHFTAIARREIEAGFKELNGRLRGKIEEEEPSFASQQRFSEMLNRGTPRKSPSKSMNVSGIVASIDEVASTLVTQQARRPKMASVGTSPVPMERKHVVDAAIGDDYVCTPFPVERIVKEGASMSTQNSPDSRGEQASPPAKNPTNEETTRKEQVEFVAPTVEEISFNILQQLFAAASRPEATQGTPPALLDPEDPPLDRAKEHAEANSGSLLLSSRLISHLEASVFTRLRDYVNVKTSHLVSEVTAAAVPIATKNALESARFQSCVQGVVSDTVEQKMDELKLVVVREVKEIVNEEGLQLRHQEVVTTQQEPKQCRRCTRQIADDICAQCDVFFSVTGESNSQNDTGKPPLAPKDPSRGSPHSDSVPKVSLPPLLEDFLLSSIQGVVKEQEATIAAAVAEGWGAVEQAVVSPQFEEVDKKLVYFEQQIEEVKSKWRKFLTESQLASKPEKGPPEASEPAVTASALQELIIDECITAHIAIWEQLGRKVTGEQMAKQFQTFREEMFVVIENAIVKALIPVREYLARCVDYDSLGGILEAAKLREIQAHEKVLEE